MANCYNLDAREVKELLQNAEEQSKLTFCGKKGRTIPESTAKRNARERNRVHHLNSSLDSLKKCLPPQWRKGRLSKCGILRRSTDYIRYLLNELEKSSGDDLTYRQSMQSSTWPANSNYGDTEQCETFSNLNSQWNLGVQNPLEQPSFPSDAIMSDNFHLVLENTDFSDMSMIETNSDQTQLFSSCMYQSQAKPNQYPYADS